MAALDEGGAHPTCHGHGPFPGPPHGARLQAETQQRYAGHFAAFRTLLEVVHTA